MNLNKLDLDTARGLLGAAVEKLLRIEQVLGYGTVHELSPSELGDDRVRNYQSYRELCRLSASYEPEGAVWVLSGDWEA